jgi:DNA-binding MarR family transcriptional regulator
MERKTAVAELSRSAFTLITDAQRAMSRSFDVPRVGVLRTVAAAGPLRPSGIAEALNMAPSSVTRHVQALEDAGQVAVQPDPADARTCLIELTEAGQTELDQLTEAGDAVFGRVVADWDVEDLQVLARLMTRLTADWAERGPAARKHARSTPRWRYAPNGDKS